MSLATCAECGGIIDTDEDPDACVEQKDYASKITEDSFLCEDCRADFDSMDLEKQFDKLMEAK